MTKFLYALTRRNWGWPYHVLEALYLSACFITFYYWLISGMHVGFYYALSFLSTNVIGYIYEVIQIKKDSKAQEEFWEDMIGNNVGVVLGCILFWIISKGLL